MSELPDAAAAPEPGTDAEWQVLAGIDPRTAGFPLRARIGGETIWVFRIGGAFRAVERSCPHQQASLGDAILQGGDKMIRCRRHNFVFRLSDGKGVNCPGYKLRVFDVKEENGALLVRVVR